MKDLKIYDEVVEGFITQMMFTATINQRNLSEDMGEVLNSLLNSHNEAIAEMNDREYKAYRKGYEDALKDAGVQQK